MPVTKEQWEEVWPASADPEKRDPVFRSVAAEFDELISQRPSIVEDLKNGIAARLPSDAASIDDHTYAEVDRFLALLVGYNIKRLIAWTVIDPEPRLLMIEGWASPAVASAMRSVIAYNAPKLADAYTAFSDFPDNWRNILRDVIYTDSLGLSFRLIITKYNGQDVVIQTPPSSLTGLGVYCLETVIENESFKNLADIAQSGLTELLGSITTWMAESNDAQPSSPVDAADLAPDTP